MIEGEKKKLFFLPSEVHKSLYWIIGLLLYLPIFRNIGKLLLHCNLI